MTPAVRNRVLTAAAKHARKLYPEESCGLVVGGRYIRCTNEALPPEQHVDKPGCGCRLCSFVISNDTYLEHADGLQMVVHSHPNGPSHPSKADMQAQEASGVTWAIIPLDEAREGAPVIWGGDTPVAPLIGRAFIHGVHDCYSLIRDVFALGRYALAEQGIDGWPYAPVELPVYPRDDQWWQDGEDNFYEEKPAEIGFRVISASEARAGDVFLCRVRSDKLNHGGVLVDQHLILHHLPNRLSRREPAGIWAGSAERWLRLENAPLAA